MHRRLVTESIKRERQQAFAPSECKTQVILFIAVLSHPFRHFQLHKIYKKRYCNACMANRSTEGLNRACLKVSVLWYLIIFTLNVQGCISLRQTSCYQPQFCYVSSCNKGYSQLQHRTTPTRAHKVLTSLSRRAQ